MNSEQEKELELEIDLELKGLEDLEAPVSLSHRVMQAIARRQALPWYSQPWQSWPPPLRIAALALLSLMFGGLCFASWRLTRAAGVTAAMQELGGLFSGLTTLWNILNVLLGAVVLVARHLGTGFIIGCITITAVCYAACLGLGTAWFRLASARR